MKKCELLYTLGRIKRAYKKLAFQNDICYHSKYSIASKGNSETLALQKILDASADYAVKAHKQGNFRPTQEVMNYIGKEW